MNSFCTLFDSNYIDKGLTLYNSLERNAKDYCLYIFCFDDKTYEILNDLNLKHVVIIHHSAFETPELLEKREERSKAEYCWTCTTWIIEYVLDHYDTDNCTYIDSDLYFFDDPQKLVDEIKESGSDVAIVPHRFKKTKKWDRIEKKYGTYCVQYNYFNQSENSRNILKYWKDKCFEWCYDIPEPDRMGDQKYLNDWPDRFEKVHVVKNEGAGTAPWNLERFKLSSTEKGKIYLADENNDVFSIIFFHFQNIRYLSKNKVNIKSQTGDKRLKYAIYIPYLKEIESARSMLSDKYGIRYSANSIIHTLNPIRAYIQRKILPYKTKFVSDIIKLDKLDNYK